MYAADPHVERDDGGAGAEAGECHRVPGRCRYNNSSSNNNNNRNTNNTDTTTKNNVTIVAV